MKRLLLCLAFAIGLLAVLAAPAFAGPTAPTYREPTNVPIILGNSGLWYVDSGQTGNPNSDITWWQATDPTAASYKALPLGQTIYFSFGWFGAIYGQVQNLTKDWANALDISGPQGSGFSESFSAAQVAACWSGPFQWDAWWSAFVFGPPPALVNPSQAGEYLQWLSLPVGPLTASGAYDFHVTQLQLRPITDLVNYGTGKVSHTKPGWSSPNSGTWDIVLYAGS